MHLYTNSVSPNGRRVAIALKEKGMEVPATEIDVRKGENLAKDYLAKNPAGRVPVLETDQGRFIAETVAITRYLEGLAPEPSLFGEGAEEQAVIEMWNRRAEFNLLVPLGQAFRNLTGLFKDREKVCKEWGEISAEAANDALGVFEQQLAGSDFIAGGRFSVADITLGTTLAFGKATKVLGEAGLAQPNIAAYMGRLAARPSFS